MGSEIELVSDGDSLVAIGASADIERFFLSTGLAQLPSREIDLQRLRSFSNTGAEAAKVGAELAANSGQWVKLTADSAAAVKEFGLMATKTPGVSHAMIGDPGDIKQWLQIAQAPTALLSGPFAITALATMMQQRAMQEQMDDIVEYLQEINEKVDDILRSQKDAVLADVIGVDLIIEDALAVRNRVGRVSEVTWSKVQSCGLLLARTQGYALRQLDSIASKLGKKADLAEVVKVTKAVEPKVHEWLAVLARTVQLQDGLSILELDRVFDAAPGELESHRIGLTHARQNRVEVIAGCTAGILTQMNDTVQRANKSVLFNPFDAPAAVKSSDKVAAGVLTFRGRLGIDSEHGENVPKRWRQAAVEVRDKALASASEGVAVAGRLGAETFDRASGVFRSIDLDGDGVPDKPRAVTAAENAGDVVKGAASTVTGAIGAIWKRKSETNSPIEPSEPGVKTIES
ncbi:hypothetical protein I6E68_09350 [Salinibacterium sp. NSLL150]|uniref:hypothetical protein n=1 Tax=unclassified Salinibacterium TaxID=2632331 RepID=UPI0018CE1F77|nr:MULTISPECIES: hypothetical protein [unclassified Salinibacterium]MBH0102098.1 hypothetical protein [Salinibacterium sp. NSLL150]